MSVVDGMLVPSDSREPMMSTQPDTRPVPVDPPAAFRSPAFAQGMVLPAGPTLYVGGQNGIDGDGTLLDGLGPQTEQAMRNVLAVLAEAGTDADHVAILRIFLTAGVDPTAAYEASARVWGRRRTAVTVVAVPESRPGVLVEVEAVASVPVPA